ncbi:Methylsterol monooxygenase 2-1 [Hondaea fermentalgiana]|uniref:Methylsterol monooxygenase 2-1 n=1 Tax=Hondaea fermentalgiana TaxID=2315210 RepID=A0A2R5GFD2_9STRA|nr:Methylsterol monooxygenase 2-1 [Hondaea fermentalgiana]|eukprot:GBG28468.1 Methylsterol monooxygenase 2-1 [Hondaea fermentalgiana]
MATATSARAGGLPFLTTTEQKLAAGLALATVAYGFVSADEVKALRQEEIERSGKAQRRPNADKIQDHPVASWAITNASVWAAVLAKYKLVGEMDPRESFAVTFARMVIGNSILVDGSVGVNSILINKVYAHVPFFSDKRLKQTSWDVFVDYMKCNGFAKLLLGVFQVHGFLKKKTVPEPYGPWRPLRFLARLVWFRVIVDVLFWAGHRVLHSKKVYAVGHRTHHEHSATQLTTNYHFDWWDLVIEAYVPFIFATASYKKFFGAIDQFDMSLLSTYIFWHEIESHAGKPMPTMPFLAPLSTWTQKFDDFNSWFHEIHHRTLKYNLSITPWFDQLMGTDRWDL